LADTRDAVLGRGISSDQQHSEIRETGDEDLMHESGPGKKVNLPVPLEWRWRC
jgi:hypothetical protein